MEKFDVTFSREQIRPAVLIEHRHELNRALKELGLESPRPTLVLVGGAARMSAPVLFQLHELFLKGLAQYAEDRGLYVVDGATDAGVIQMIGRARAELGADFHLIGVAARGTVALPKLAPPSPEAWPLEPNHTHFVFVPGSNWGVEAGWIAQTATLLCGGMRSVTILVNGGEIAWKDVEESVRVGRPVLIAGGSGRTADILAGALRGEAMPERAGALVRSGLLRAVDLKQGYEKFMRTVEEILFRKEKAH